MIKITKNPVFSLIFYIYFDFLIFMILWLFFTFNLLEIYKKIYRFKLTVQNFGVYIVVSVSGLGK